MLELKVARKGKLNDEQQLSAILFIGKNSGSDEYMVVAIINDPVIMSYTASYDRDSWLALREESEFSTDEDFIAELANMNNTLRMERSECIQMKWIRPDESGLTFEFCTMTLKPNIAGTYDVVSALLMERNIYYDNAIKSENIVAGMERKLELLAEKVDEMEDYRQNLSTTLISKFVAIQNKKTNS
uniref:Uncharacterized protein n=1 Tax=Setaria digitata TaxID=48799 RepID=A0A915PQE4_9BILA